MIRFTLLFFYFIFRCKGAQFIGFVSNDDNTRLVLRCTGCTDTKRCIELRDICKSNKQSKHEHILIPVAAIINRGYICVNEIININSIFVRFKTNSIKSSNLFKKKTQKTATLSIVNNDNQFIRSLSFQLDNNFVRRNVLHVKRCRN